MDKVGIAELLRSGRDAIRPSVKARRDATKPEPFLDERASTVLDRLTQLGVILIDAGEIVVFTECVSTLLDIFRFGIPKDTGFNAVQDTEAEFLLQVIQRVFVLGAYATTRQRLDCARVLIQQVPDDTHRRYYWIRYAVTMISRGHVTTWRKSLIGPSSEYVRTRPEFFVLFDDNMDAVVDAMCQFDFVQCVVAVHDSHDLTSCYPNFGAYWNRRTIPIVKELVGDKRARASLGEITDLELAEILKGLDNLAAEVFFEFAGWDRISWDDESINRFLAKNLTKS